METLKSEILEHIENAFKKAEQYYGRSFSRHEHIVWSHHGTTAGWCNFFKKSFMFQLELAKQNKDNFLEVIVPHEVAHWIDRELYGYKRTRQGRLIKHGKTWKDIMVNVYGLKPDRCHSYDTSATLIKKRNVSKGFQYTCGCPGRLINLTIVRHNKIQKGKVYICTFCNTKLTPYHIPSPEILEAQKILDTIQRLTNNSK